MGFEVEPGQLANLFRAAGSSVLPSWQTVRMPWHVDVHVELVIASHPNVNGRDLDGLASLAQVVELLPYQPVRVDGSVDSQGLVDLVLGSAARWVWSLLTRHLLQC